MRHYVNHRLGTRGARQLVNAAFEHYASEYLRHEPRLDWLDSETARISAIVLGVRVTAEVRLTPTTLELEGRVPWSLRMFRGMARRLIDEEARRWVRRFEAERLAIQDY